MTHAEAIADICAQLDAFLASPASRRWLENDVMKIYVRKTTRMFAGHPPRGFLDIANVDVKHEADQRKGLFAAFLTFAEATGMPIYLELADFDLVPAYLRRGYTLLPNDGPQHPNLYKLAD